MIVKDRDDGTLSCNARTLSTCLNCPLRKYGSVSYLRRAYF